LKQLNKRVKKFFSPVFISYLHIVTCHGRLEKQPWLGKLSYP